MVSISVVFLPGDKRVLVNSVCGYLLGDVVVIGTDKNQMVSGIRLLW